MDYREGLDCFVPRTRESATPSSPKIDYCEGLDCFVPRTRESAGDADKALAAIINLTKKRERNFNEVITGIEKRNRVEEERESDTFEIMKKLFVVAKIHELQGHALEWAHHVANWIRPHCGDSASPAEVDEEPSTSSDSESPAEVDEEPSTTSPARSADEGIRKHAGIRAFMDVFVNVTQEEILQGVEEWEPPERQPSSGTSATSGTSAKGAVTSANPRAPSRVIAVDDSADDDSEDDAEDAREDAANIGLCTSFPATFVSELPYSDIFQQIIDHWKDVEEPPSEYLSIIAACRAQVAQHVDDVDWSELDF